MKRNKKWLISKFKSYCKDPEYREEIVSNIKLQTIISTTKDYHIGNQTERIGIFKYDEDRNMRIFSLRTFPGGTARVEWFLTKDEYDELLNIYIGDFDLDFFIKQQTVGYEMELSDMIRKFNESLNTEENISRRKHNKRIQIDKSVIRLKVEGGVIQAEPETIIFFPDVESGSREAILIELPEKHLFENLKMAYFNGV